MSRSASGRNPRRLPSWSAPVLFGGILSGLMTMLVSGISTVRALGLEQASVGDWAVAFWSSWPVTFPAVLVLAPLVRRLVVRLTVAPSAR